MPLDPAKIKALLEKKQTRARTPRGARSKANLNDRSYQAWFKHDHILIKEKEPVFCDNPDCIDVRDKKYGQVVVDLNGTKMCRFCFIEGWLVISENQSEIAV